MKKEMSTLIATVSANETPPAVIDAVTELGDKLAKERQGWKAFFYKNGSFSKTATFATVANLLVLFSFVLGFFAGMDIEIMDHVWTVPEFNDKAAWSILAIVNGTYIGNNMVKVKANGHG
jgi:hypothetical protein